MLPWLAWTLCRPGWPQLTEICLPLLPKAGIRDLYAPPHLACFFSPDMGLRRTGRKLWALSPLLPQENIIFEAPVAMRGSDLQGFRQS